MRKNLWDSSLPWLGKTEILNQPGKKGGEPESKGTGIPRVWLSRISNESNKHNNEADDCKRTNKADRQNIIFGSHPI
jgi:hypothetical protein